MMAHQTLFSTETTTARVAGFTPLPLVALTELWLPDETVIVD
jgi:hypothetical protein